MNKKYSKEHIDYIEANIKGCPFKELTDKFNEQFNMDSSVLAVIALANKHGLRNGCDARFTEGYVATQFNKGHIPWNKGKKGLCNGGTQTQYKLGHRSANWVPLGSERINADGYVDIKVQDGKSYKNWKRKHILIWEAHNGCLVPPVHAVIFGDGNRRNFNPENLILVSRAQLVRMNQRGLIQHDVELTKTGAIIADVCNRIGELRKKGRIRR